MAKTKKGKIPEQKKSSKTEKIAVGNEPATEKGGWLSNLEISNIGPIEFSLPLKSRLNIITGDNGLGKSYILECAWWALTNTWTGNPIYPDFETVRLGSVPPEINYTFLDSNNSPINAGGRYDWESQDWELRPLELQNNGLLSEKQLVIYAKADGAYAIWDPARTDYKIPDVRFGKSTVLTKDHIWNGLRLDDNHKSRSLFNGIITDWALWQTAGSHAFDLLKKVLSRLSPPNSLSDLGPLSPGALVRIPGESRLMPSIKHPYGDVPITFASEAVKSIVGLAYLIVWTWLDHAESTKLKRRILSRQITVILDEIESHLHPQWQRAILPALLTISDDLSSDLNIQFLVTTHSPLVLASIESEFDENKDHISHLDLKYVSNQPKVVLEPFEFEKRGSTDSWLTSRLFEMKQARSIKAEAAIEAAKLAMSQKKPTQKSIAQIGERLLDCLPAHDIFWVRWNYFAEKFHVSTD